jgi:transposase
MATVKRRATRPRKRTPSGSILEGLAGRDGRAPISLDHPPPQITGAPPGFLAWVETMRAYGTHGGDGHGKFTPARRAIIVGAIASGGSVDVAARRAGIHGTTLRDWITRGQREVQAQTMHETGKGPDPGPTPYGAFVLEILIAIGYWETELLGIVKAAAVKGDIRAACWLLERVGGKLAAERVEIDMAAGQSATELGDVRARIAEQWASMRARKAALASGEAPGREDE